MPLLNRKETLRNPNSVANPHQFGKPDTNPEPYQSEKPNPDSHQSQKLDPEPHQSQSLGDVEARKPWMSMDDHVGGLKAQNGAMEGLSGIGSL